MSWSLNKKGTKDEVKKYLDEEAPKLIGHVQGVERSIADQALGLMRAVVEANEKPESYDLNVSGFGSANFDGQQNQLSQSVSISISTPYKP